MKTTLGPVLRQCTSDFERINCLAISTAPAFPVMHWYTVTATLTTGLRYTERMHRSSLDSAVSSMRALLSWKGLIYSSIESRPD